MTRVPSSVPLDVAMASLIQRRPALGPVLVRGAFKRATDADGRQALRHTLRWVVTARGLDAVAATAGMTPAALTEELSDRGNPSFATLVAVTSALGLRLITVERPAAKPKRTRKPAAAAQ